MQSQLKSSDEYFFDLALAILRYDEGEMKYPYDDGTAQRVKGKGHITIGIGRNLDDNPLSPDEIRYLFRNDFEAALSACHRLFGLVFFEGLETPRRISLLNMMFQMGYGRLVNFRKTIKEIRECNWNGAAKEALNSQWAKTQSPKRAQRVAHGIRTGTFHLDYITHIAKV